MSIVLLGRPILPKILPYVAGGMLVLAYMLHMVTAAKSALNGLAVSSEFLNFGDVWAQHDFQWKLPVENRTGETVHVSRILADCRCTWIEPQSFVLPPGGSIELRVVLDLLARDARSTDEWQEFALSIKPVLSKGSPIQQGWELRGRVQHALAIGQPRIRFEAAEELVRGTVFRPRSTKLRPLVPLKQLLVTTDSRMGSAWVTTDEKLEAFEVFVEPHFDLPEGPFSFDLNLHPLTLDGRRLPAIKLPISGTVAAEFQAFPSLVQLKRGTPDGEASEMVTIRSRSGVAFQVQSATPSSEYIAVSPPVADVMATEHTFRVANRLQTDQLSNERITFVVRDDAGQVGQIVVNVIGQGQM